MSRAAQRCIYKEETHWADAHNGLTFLPLPPPPLPQGLGWSILKKESLKHLRWWSGMSMANNRWNPPYSSWCDKDLGVFLLLCCIWGTHRPNWYPPLGFNPIMDDPTTRCCDRTRRSPGMSTFSPTFNELLTRYGNSNVARTPGSVSTGSRVNYGWIITGVGGGGGGYKPGKCSVKRNSKP